MKGVSNLFNIKSIAVVGASRHKEKPGYAVFENLLKNKNLNVYPVNPKAKQILNKKSYNSLEQIPHKIDCVIFAIKAKLIPLMLRQAGKRKIKSSVIISAGFAESGNLDLEKRIKHIAEKYNITLLGPNVLGYIYTPKNINASFFKSEKLQKGDTAFISQSGAIGVGILDSLEKRNISLSSFISIGNSTCLGFPNFINYFSKDKFTKKIILYIEGLKKSQGIEFLKQAKKSKKPIIAIKAGKTSQGQKAASTHTSALATDSKVYSGIFQQAGIIEADSIKQAFQISKITHISGKPLILTNAGGLGVLTSDYCEQNKITLAKIPEKEINQLSKFLPKDWSKQNPVDIIGDATPERYGKTISYLENKKFFDYFIVLLTPQEMTNPKQVAKILCKSKKPIIACFIGDKQTSKAKQILQKHNIPVFEEPKELCEAIGKI